MKNKDRSTNIDNLLFQKQNIEEKIVKLQISLEGIEKSLKRLRENPELSTENSEVK